MRKVTRAAAAAAAPTPRTIIGNPAPVEGVEGVEATDPSEEPPAEGVDPVPGVEGTDASEVPGAT